MKYVLLTILTLVVSLCLGALLARLIEKKRRAEWTAMKRFAASVALGVAIVLLATGAYLAVYYPADDSVQDALASDGAVEVRTTGEGILFDGKGESTALVFFPGAKVQTEAYAPLMHRIAEQGVDCVLVDPPAHMAILGVGRGEQVLTEYDYEHWIVGGHSLGGIAACSVAADAAGKVDGIVLLASYPTSEVSPDVALLSIYGSEDAVLDSDSYARGSELWPTDARELVIAGGNHAGYGNYGAQRGDGAATITAEQQQDQTAQAVIDLAQRISGDE